jgi:oxygen-dependent protoporphyrinogen oxidase
MQSQHKQVVVIGAGISGLVCAYRLKSLGVDVALIEKSAHVGGVIQSRQVDDFLIERGPNSTRGTAEFLSLIEELGLMSELIEGNPKAPAYVYHNGKMRAVPMGPASLLKTDLLSFGGKLRLFKEPFVSKREATGEESVHDFFSRRLGLEAAERLVAPFVSGIYAGDENRLSVQAAFPMLAELENDSGSLFRGGIVKAKAAKREKQNAQTEKPKTKRSVSFRKGLSQLTETLAAKLGDDLIKNVEFAIQSVQATSADNRAARFAIAIKPSEHEQTITCQNLVFATPAYVTSSIIASFSDELSRLLGEVEYPPVSIVHLAYDKAAQPNAIEGFGVLVAPVDRMNILGCLFSSSLFAGRAPNDKYLFTVFMGGARTPELTSLSDDELVAKAHQDVGKILNLKASPTLISISRWPRAIPQYNLGHATRLKRIAELTDPATGIYLAGNYLNGVSISDCVQAADRLGRGIASQN